MKIVGRGFFICLGLFLIVGGALTRDTAIIIVYSVCGAFSLVGGFWNIEVFGEQSE